MESVLRLDERAERKDGSILEAIVFRSPSSKLDWKENRQHHCYTDEDEHC